jgi:hypothetical protein
LKIEINLKAGKRPEPAGRECFLQVAFLESQMSATAHRLRDHVFLICDNAAGNIK